MKINTADIEIISSLAKEMASYGYRYAAYPLNLPTDSDTIQFFKTSMGAEDHCLVGPNDIDYFKSMPIDSLINDLTIVMQSGIDTSGREILDVTAFANLERERKGLLQNNLNIMIMNEKNFEYLKDQLKYTGFGESLGPVLKEHIENGQKEFTIKHENNFDSSSLSSELHFKKSDQSDLYFFNSYKAILQKEGSSHAPEQIFYVSKDNTFTMKEAFNLLEGRAVNKDLKNKEGEMYNCWCKMDFKNAENNGNFKLNYYHENFGYNLEAALAKHSIKELDTPKFKEDLLNSLKKGNLQSVTFVVGGVETKMHVEANPHFKTVNVYDTNLQRISHRESKDLKQKDTQDKTVSKEQKKDLEGEPAGEDQKEGRKKKKQSQSI